MSLSPWRPLCVCGGGAPCPGLRAAPLWALRSWTAPGSKLPSWKGGRQRGRHRWGRRGEGPHPGPPEPEGTCAEMSTALHIAGLFLVPPSCARAPRFSRERPRGGQGSRSTSILQTGHHGCSRWEEASAADGAHGFPRGPGRQRGPVGEALLASPLLGRTPGGSGGIGPNADVIPAPLEGEGQVNRLEGVKGQRPSFQRLKDPRGTLPGPPTSSTPGSGLWPHSPGPRGRRARPLTPMP